ncbi:hypothetical protein HOP50_01g04350 [Chloropicon primus]|uniref:Uncharacterized protein n=2 Tax=Chloropicon primus TaxID=1764295 RepID=A0A5B8MC67_9CHLO|nr:hypothetical protein A3770_01p04470 [Chloropicon primus]UPQ97144.1 hypothetical protein HOP50_01g04350 [Chloropicon primus]|eukprot:QDZ17929.1 hypothetical protein A3770_01p04470 [Chloropicon primus]
MNATATSRLVERRTAGGLKQAPRATSSAPVFVRKAPKRLVVSTRATQPNAPRRVGREGERRRGPPGGGRGRGGGRLYGKNLQNGIKGAGSVEEILEMVAESEDFLDHIHTCTAMYKMAKLMQGERRSRGGQNGRDGESRALLEDPRFLILKKSIESQINKFDSWATANLLYSFALMRCNPGFSLLDLLTGHAVSLGSLLSTVDVSNAFWAFSQLKYKPHPDVLHNLWEVAVLNISVADIRSIAGLLESAVKTGHKPSKPSLVTISERILDSWDSVSAREAATVFISFVRLGFVPPPELLDAVDSKMQDNFGEFSNRDVAICLSAFRLAKHKPGERLLAVILRKVNTSFEDFKDRDIVQILYSLAKMNVDPGVKNLDRCANMMVCYPKTCTAEGSLRILEAYVNTGYEPAEEFIALVKQKNKKTNARSGQILRHKF